MRYGQNSPKPADNGESDLKVKALAYPVTVALIVLAVLHRLEVLSCCSMVLQHHLASLYCSMSICLLSRYIPYSFILMYYSGYVGAGKS